MEGRRKSLQVLAANRASRPPYACGTGSNSLIRSEQLRCEQWESTRKRTPSTRELGVVIVGGTVQAAMRRAGGAGGVARGRETERRGDEREHSCLG